ncbi:MAG: hypothetical protein ACSHWZ_10075 [Sulfitobacter sp.]
MKQIALNMALASLLFAASPAFAADCYADYKAKQDNPLRLHYGVAEITGACKKGAAKRELSQRLARDGWTLLNILSVFGPEGLSERKDSAGSNFLRF